MSLLLQALSLVTCKDNMSPRGLDTSTRAAIVDRTVVVGCWAAISVKGWWFIHARVSYTGGNFTQGGAYVTGPASHPGPRFPFSCAVPHLRLDAGRDAHNLRTTRRLASFATSSIKPHQRPHRMRQTLDLDPCLARLTITTHSVPF